MVIRVDIDELIDYKNNEYNNLYYDEIQFHFMNDDLISWVINSNFSEYSDLLNVNKLNIYKNMR
jgi:hypothetical protein